MTNYESNKPNYNDAKFDHEYYANQSSYDRQGQPSYPPMPSYKESRHNIYKDEEVNGKDFIMGVIIGGIIGATTALLLAPKTGTELRDSLTSQAGQLKEKTIDLSSTAKEKTTQISKQLQEQSGQLVDKVKNIKGSPASPLDDGTASSEGEEPMDFMETISQTTEELTEEEENATAVAEAIKEAITEENDSNSNSNSKKTTTTKK
ncbi:MULTISPECIES: YtxH domain-containing protein [Psychrobacillus]|uniref:YtxH domain-containing protein n=1 Tax=Psychrobacillus faecigallinarum TaxID=2762235 RepID=A0ABR8R6R0_9BACI|nr:YtxH domain-containing protein [Psychrobacillus faecigallinarum]MBD7943486.1 YtxH domain-containing protein [Psychrobacillus faecigallinarum]QGM29518.1 YtxH domain-containing protein [Bacillus sp. N3536]